MVYRFRAGGSPTLISIPHHGTFIPSQMAQTMTAAGRSSRDTDWFLEDLYRLPEWSDANFLIAEWSRFVIDLNRPLDDESLYPGQTTTGLFPSVCFDGSPIYAESPPDDDQRKWRIDNVWRPYHERLEQEIQRLRQSYRHVVLLEAHSIESNLPRLFDGILPDFNVGTVHGQSCDRGLEETVSDVLRNQSHYSFVVNGRFIGGYITRHFGRPSDGVHAIQIELSQATYLDESLKVWNAEKAARVQSVFRQLATAISQWLGEKNHGE